MRTLASETLAVYREAVARMDAGRLVAAELAGRALRRTRVLAVGKVAGPMMEAALAALGDLAIDPLCVLRREAPAPAGAEIVRGSHPRPDHGSLDAGRAILGWAERHAGLDALVLLSGGASSLACAPVDDVPFAEKVTAADALMSAGLSIHELNAARKHLSRLKGGQLARLLAPARTAVLVLSDVPGDDLSTIASGPLAPDPTTFADVLRVVRECDCERVLPASVLGHFHAGAAGAVPETPKPGDPCFAGVGHRVLAGPRALAKAAGALAAERGYHVTLLDKPVEHDVAIVARQLAAWAGAQPAGARRMLVAAGEPTVKVVPGGEGGRDQHLALLMARALDGRDAAFLAAGSDGRDGPTDLAGACVDGETAREARSRGLDLDAELARSRSGPAVRALGAGVERFDSRTHLCDLFLVATR